MTNQPNTPAAVGAPNIRAAFDRVSPSTQDQTPASRSGDRHLPAPAEVVTVVDLPPGVFAPLVVVESMESAQALAQSGLLPGPARILVVSSLEALTALRLPEPHREAGLAEHVQDGPALQHPRRVVFAPDGNPESLQAARQAARHARAAGWTVDGLPAPEGFQWADVEAKRVPPPEADLARIVDLWVPPPANDPCPEADPREDLDPHLRGTTAGLAPDLESRLGSAPA